MNLVIVVRACHFVCFVVLLLDCRVRPNVVLFAHSVSFEWGKVNCEFADSQLAHYPDPQCTNQFLLVFISYCRLGPTLEKFSQFNTSDKKK